MGDPPKPRRRAEAPRGYISVGVVARTRGVRTQTLKRQMKRLEIKAGLPLLIQFSKRGHNYLRIDNLRQVMPEFVTPQILEEAEETTTEYGAAVTAATQHQEIRELVLQVLDELSQLRDLVVMTSDKGKRRLT